MRILSDTGGTNARFAIEEDGQIYDGRTYKAANFPLFEEAFEQYKRDVNLTMRPQALLLATAAQPDGQGLWHFATGNRWGRGI